MKIDKILKIETSVDDKIEMILSNNIDIVWKGEPAVSINNFKQLRMEILAWHESEVLKLNIGNVSKEELDKQNRIAYDAGMEEAARLMR